MRIFGKKDEDEEGFVPKKSLDKSGKEPVRRRRKKEQKKPWGKKERTFVFAVLFSTAAISGVLAISARSWKLPGAPRITLPNLSLEQTYVFDNGKTQPQNQGRKERVLADFNNEVKNLSGVYGLYIVELTSGDSYGIYEHETFQAASLIKLPVMVGMLMGEETGGINLNKKYTLKDSDKIGGSGSLQYKPAGTVFTYRELLELMGQQSDNTAFNICKKILGDDRIAEIISEIGMSNTSLADNTTSPYDIGIFFKKLWDKRLVNKEHRDELLGYLTGTIYEDHLAAGVPDGIKIAHKYGREVHVVNDAGIVYAKSPYIVVIISKGVVETEADSVFPVLSTIIYDDEQKY